MVKIILDLCGGTGSWSKPYRDAGYPVIKITLPEYDVRKAYFYNDMIRFPHIEQPYTEVPISKVYGILAAPPCTDFSISGAQYWKAKDKDGRTIDSMSVVLACLLIIAKIQPKWWALENPVGRLSGMMGKYRMMFNPCDYGDPYTKKTCLWGNFKEPEKAPVTPIRVSSQGSWVQRLGGKSARTKELRSVTPSGFAKAFFKANK